MVFLREFFENDNFQKNQQTTKNHEKFPSLQSVNVRGNTGLDKQNKNQRKNVSICVPVSFNICFGCSKEPSHLDGSFEYPQHMFWLRNKKITFSLGTLN